MARDAVGDRGRLNPGPRQVASDAPRLRLWMRQQVVGELEDLVLTGAGEELGDDVVRERRPRGLVGRQLLQLGVDYAEVWVCDARDRDSDLATQAELVGASGRPI